jgi:hypothetical protein
MARMLHIVSTGRGYLVFVIVFGCSLLITLIFKGTFDQRYLDRHEWPTAVSFLMSSAICWLLGNFFRKRSARLARVVIDKQTGKEFVISQPRHTFFWIPMQWWGAILLVGSVILFGMEFSR